ncbi:MAG: VWA domain-containing protein [Blautia sp.]|nr:VWA domain-containing protein [Blautia sp.]
MIFESLWPLALLLSVPVVIILYLLKPRGKDYRISSNLLWEKLFRNQQSRTFLEKFVHNILMYLQILILLLLVLALMSPYIRREGRSKGNVILVLDTSASMQHDAGNGRTRMEEALGQIRDLISASEETAFSLVTNDCMGTELLAVGVKDKGSLYAMLERIECCDGPGNLPDAESVVETLRGADAEAGEGNAGAEVIVFTDGSGAEDAMSFSRYFDARVLVMGHAVSNVANNFLSYVERGTQAAGQETFGSDDPADDQSYITCASSITNYSDAEASMEVSLYHGDKLLEVRQLTVPAGETTLCYFEPFAWQGEALRSEIGSVRFAGSNERDSLESDNMAYAVPAQASRIDAVLVGNGNTYIEKAYQAATGMSLTRVDRESALAEDAGVVRIYDAGAGTGDGQTGSGGSSAEAAGGGAGTGSGQAGSSVSSAETAGGSAGTGDGQTGSIANNTEAAGGHAGTGNGPMGSSVSSVVTVGDSVGTGSDSMGSSARSVATAGGSAGTGSGQVGSAAAEGNYAGNRLVFRGTEHSAGTAERVMLTVTDCDLTAGLPSFLIGVNETNVYEIPSWGTGFLWAGGQCAGYYGEHDGIREVAVGFDIRESDFPLKAEFPVFIANALRFLGDTSLLADNIYEAGEAVVFHPQADFDVDTLAADTGKAGLYSVTAGEITEQYVVRFATGKESDGRPEAEGTVDQDAYSSQLVKKQLRNVALAVVLILMAVEWILYVRQMRYRGKFYLIVRGVGVILILLALFGFSVNKRSGANTTIFLVDISNSNAGNLPEMEAWLDDALNEMPRNNQYGIVTFGKNSLVEQFLTKEDHFSRIMSLPDKTATNFEDAMSRALAMIPANGAGRVVILTDGKETRGSLAGTASALVSRQVELLALVYDAGQGQDAYVENVELPSYLYQGDSYSMTVTVESNYETDAQIQIWMGTMQTAGYDVHLNRGSNQFRFQQKVTGESVESFEVRVVAAGDTCGENDSYHAYSVVDSVPRVLLVSGLREDSSQYENLLRSAGSNYSVVSAINAPDTLEELLEYKSVLLENVYLSDLPEGFLENIETYVKDYGCGLVCMGGGESYALGGYRETVLETVLPVDMELRGVDEIPSMAMIMVIDHSGSMGSRTETGATDLELAITAAETAVDQMRSADYVGVVTFDDSFSWVVEPVQASDKDTIKAQIETIAEGGGTTIKPALWAALNGVSACDVSIRHVILLTDGQGESANFNDIVAGYSEAGVTLSTVAVGQGSDTRLLKQLADRCGGRYYYSDMSEEIPKIFAQEVFLSGDTYLQNGTFSLAVNGVNEITRGLFEEGWPLLYGYVSATPKAASSVLIASEKDDPVLTVMQYGLGHTVAWNTDVTNQWTAGYAGEGDYVQLWKRIIDYSVGNAAIGEDTVDVATAGGYTSIVYDALDFGEQTKVEAVYTDPQGNTQTAPLHATAPGTYEAKLDTDVTGIYNLSVRRLDDGNITNAVTTAMAVQYSDEYKFDVGTGAFTGFVERYGRMLAPEENFWQQRRSDARERYELTKWLILLAVLWFVLDIALRRFHFLPQDTKLYRMIAQRLGQRRGGAGTGTKRGAVQGDVAGIPAAEAGKLQDAERSAGADSGTFAGTDAGVSAGADDAGRAAASGQAKKGKKPKKADRAQEPQALDTSALLKKKDQRKQ